MTDAEFQALIDAANARLAQGIEQSFNKAKEDIHASFQECFANLNARFAKAAEELGATLPENTRSLSEFSADRKTPLQQPPEPESETYYFEYSP